MEYRRTYIPGGTYFFTLVTYKRRPIFSDLEAIDLLRKSFRYTMDRMPFNIIASAILPDHMHFIWSLPQESSDFSTRWRMIKSHFSRNWHGRKTSEVVSRQNKGEVDVWQRRFWEHLIRDEQDLSKHIEYIHYNPVKHGLVKSPADWQFSSFSKYVKDGYYPPDWGSSDDIWGGEKWME